MRNKRGQFVKGNKHSDEFIKKHSERMKGSRNPFYGMKHTQKSILIIREKRKLQAEPRKGKRHTTEAKEKNRRSHIGKRLGSLNNMWRGGITPLRDKIRKCYKYRQWRSDIFTRDNWTCQDCSKRGSIELNADHYPKSFSRILMEYKVSTLDDALNCEELWNINNGRTLCIDCHKLTPNYLKVHE